MSYIDTSASASEDTREPQQPMFGVRDMIAVLSRRKRLMAGGFLVTAALVFGIVMLQTPVYTATATMMINPGQEQVLSEDQSLGTSTTNSSVVDSEVEVLRSSEMARDVARELHLDRNPHWNPALAQLSPVASAIQAIKSAFGSPSAASNSNNPQAVLSAIGERLANKVTVRRRALSYVVDVSVENPDPAQAADIANAYVQIYLNSLIESRSQTGARATGWLGQRLQELQADLAQKEAAVEAYRAQSGLLTHEGDSLTEDQIREVLSNVLAARADLAEKEARYHQVQSLIQSGGNVDTIAGVLNSQTIRDLRSQESELTRRQTEYEGTLGAMHPLVTNGRAELEDVRRQIAAETQRIASNLRNEADVARVRLQTMEGSLGSARGQLATTNTAEVRLQQLEREATGSRTVYERFLQRYNEIAGQGQIAASQVRVVSQAVQPRQPSSPNLKLGLLFALLVGSGVALILAISAEAMNDSLRSAAEVEAKVGVPPLTSVPIVKQQMLRLLAPSDRHPSGYLVEKPMSHYAEAFRVLRTSISFSRIGKQTKVVAISSAMPGEGKTTSSLSLARVAALYGQRVIVVDCDLRRHSLNSLLEIEPKQGLLQVLMGEARWQDVAGRDESTTAHVLPVAPAPFTPHDVFGSEAMERLVAELRAAYDLVILDCPPVWAVADTRIIAGLSDGVVLVARWGKTSARATASAVRHLSPTGVSVLGVLLNCVEEAGSVSAGYSDPAYYGYSAKSYYVA